MAFNKALIVDDSKLARITLKKKLESYQLQVIVAESALEAYAATESEAPDIIFMDHLMPEVDGFEATQHLRKQNLTKSTPIIMCTGKEHEGYLEEALAIGASQILTKPPADEALEAILNTDFNDVVLGEDMDVYHTQDTSISGTDGLGDLQSNILEARSGVVRADVNVPAVDDDKQAIDVASTELIQELQQQVQQIKLETAQNIAQMQASIDVLSQANHAQQPALDSSELVSQLQKDIDLRFRQSIEPLQKQLEDVESKLQSVSASIKAVDNKPLPVGISWDESKALIKRAFAQYKEKQPSYISTQELDELKQAYDVKLEQQQQLMDSQAQSLSQLASKEENGTEPESDFHTQLDHLTRQQSDLSKLVHLPKHLSSIAIALGFCALVLSIYTFVAN